LMIGGFYDSSLGDPFTDRERADVLDLISDRRDGGVWTHFITHRHARDTGVESWWGTRAVRNFEHNWSRVQYRGTEA